MNRLASIADRIAADDMLDRRILAALREWGLLPKPGHRQAGPIMWQAVFFMGVAGSGKCFGEGTRILMYDGSEKRIEDVVVGDVVMGDDSTPRTVMETHKGHGPLFEIVPVKGDSFVVNANHVMLFKKLTADRKRIGKGEKRIKLNIRFKDVEMPLL